MPRGTVGISYTMLEQLLAGREWPACVSNVPKGAKVVGAQDLPDRRAVAIVIESDEIPAPHEGREYHEFTVIHHRAEVS